MDLLERAKILLKATKELLEKQEDSYYVLNLLTETVFYDGVDCDGTCLKDDIGYWFDELEDAQTVKTIPLDKAKEVREEIENEVKFWSEPSKYNVKSVVAMKNAKAQSYKHCLEILDKLIAESEAVK